MRKSFVFILNFLKLKWPDVIFYLILTWFLANKIPVWVSQSKSEGKPAPSFMVVDLNGNPMELPNPKEASVLIFWATWCGPCKIEMNRYQTAVDENKIPKNQIYAVSIGEDLELVKKHIAENKYSFNFVSDQNNTTSELYQVSGTPTVVHINKKQEIVWISTGISPTGIIRAESLFKD